MPDTEFIKNNISEMESKPFDGVVLHVKYRGDGSKSEDYIEWIGFGIEYLNYNVEVKKAITNLQKTKFQQFTDNFIRFNVTPGNADWFDEWGPILNNIQIAARIAKEGGLKGIFLDVEQYDSHPFKYQSQKYKDNKSFKEYTEQVRDRGREFIKAINRVYPDITVVLTFGYNLAQHGTPKVKDPSQSDYSLLPAFLDGILEGSSARTKIVDGFEFSYTYKHVRQFINGYKIIKKNSLELTALKDKYRSMVEAGFGLWLDYDSGNKGWHTDDLSKNYFTPKDFKNALISAQKISDKYVWIYSQKLNWWTGSNLPKDYIDALREARNNLYE
jgi:hypothetical protein